MNIGFKILIFLLVVGVVEYYLFSLIYEFAPDIQEYFERQELRQMRRAYSRAARRRRNRK